MTAAHLRLTDWPGLEQASECLRTLAHPHRLRLTQLNVINVEGGTQACEQAGVPVVRGKKAISLERQVRIAAGSLVLLGALLGAFVHLYWIALSAFVGAGLIFAGVTDTCGMAMLLARMPCNQVSELGDAKAGAACGACADEG